MSQTKIVLQCDFLYILEKGIKRDISYKMGQKAFR